ncbi:unnamed protein product, partial [Amoebophrya sp. A25]
KEEAALDEVVEGALEQEAEGRQDDSERRAVEREEGNNGELGDVEVPLVLPEEEEPAEAGGIFSWLFGASTFSSRATSSFNDVVSGTPNTTTTNPSSGLNVGMDFFDHAPIGPPDVCRGVATDGQIHVPMGLELVPWTGANDMADLESIPDPKERARILKEELTKKEQARFQQLGVLRASSKSLAEGFASIQEMRTRERQREHLQRLEDDMIRARQQDVGRVQLYRPEQLLALEDRRNDGSNTSTARLRSVVDASSSNSPYVPQQELSYSGLVPVVPQSSAAPAVTSLTLRRQREQEELERQRADQHRFSSLQRTADVAILVESLLIPEDLQYPNMLQ